MLDVLAAAIQLVTGQRGNTLSSVSLLSHGDIWSVPCPLAKIHAPTPKAMQCSESLHPCRRACDRLKISELHNVEKNVEMN
jgi:hypothetical protein